MGFLWLVSFEAFCVVSSYNINISCLLWQLGHSICWDEAVKDIYSIFHI